MAGPGGSAPVLLRVGVGGLHIAGTGALDSGHMLSPPAHAFLHTCMQSPRGQTGRGRYPGKGSVRRRYSIADSWHSNGPSLS